MAVSSFYKSFLGDLPNISFFSPSYTHLINKLKKHKPYSIPFLNPVRKKDAPGYYDIIKKPIDLSTIQKNTENHIYKNKSELFDDLKLMRDNCKTYNISGYIVDYGEEILKYAEKVIFVEDSDNVLEGNVIELEEQSKWSDITDSDLLEMEELYFSNDVDYDVKMDVLSFESENVPTEQIRADNVLIESNLDPNQNVLIESNLDPSQNILIESNLDPSQNILIESNLDPSQNVLIESNLDPSQNALIESNLDPSQNVLIESKDGLIEFKGELSKNRSIYSSLLLRKWLCASLRPKFKIIKKEALIILEQAICHLIKKEFKK